MMRPRPLLPTDPPAPQDTHAWLPAAIPQRITSDLRYLVVDEIVGSSVGLALSAWPHLDEQGRLRFDNTTVHMVGSSRSGFDAFLRAHRQPEALRERELRIGDVFAARVRRGALDEVAEELQEPRRLEPFLAPEDWIVPPIYDVTPDAREAAKTAFYAAVTPTLDPEESAQLLQAEQDSGAR